MSHMEKLKTLRNALHIGVGNRLGSPMGQADLACHRPGLGHDFMPGLIRYQAETLARYICGPGSGQPVGYRFGTLSLSYLLILNFALHIGESVSPSLHGDEF
jgi:hypothetical protein